MFSEIKWAFLQIIYNVMTTIFNQDRVLILYSKTSKAFGNLEPLKREITKEKIKVQSLSCDKSWIEIALWISRARVILIDQSNPIISRISIKGTTVVLQCWHGGGILKKIAFDDIRNSDLYNIKRLNRIHRNINYYVISDEKFIPQFSKAFNVPPDNILPLGLPRTDIFFKPSKIKRIFATQKKVILYAPTYRELSAKRVILEFPPIPNDLLTHYMFLFRPHPSIEIKDLPSGWEDASIYPIDKLLNSVDVLISDYSSIIFDYSFYKRPILFIVPDYDNYKNSERGLYIDLENLSPSYQIFKDWENLFEYINLGRLESSKIWNNFMSACDGKSSIKITKFIKSLYFPKSRKSV